MKKRERTRLIHKQKPDPEKSSPITSNEEIPSNPDPHIDQDFPGFPHPPSKHSHIKPVTKNDKLDAGVIKKNVSAGKNREENTQNELDSDGSANAFERTELNEQPEEKKKRNPKNSSY